MEFERSIFRVHDRLLRGPSTKKYLSIFEGFFGILSIYYFILLVLLHKGYVDKRDILRPQVEQQMKPFFYRQYEMEDSIAEYERLYVTAVDKVINKDSNLTSSINDLSEFKLSNYSGNYGDLPVLPLNYSDQSGQFLFDNSTVSLTLFDNSYYRSQSQANNTPATLERTKNCFSFDNSTGIWNVTKSNQKTNKGLRKEDIFVLLIVRSDTEADDLRTKIQSGQIQYLNQLNAKEKKHLQDERVAIYKFSAEVGSAHYAKTITISDWKKAKQEEKEDFFMAHGVGEHLLVLSLRELSRNNKFVEVFFDMKIMDISVAVLNQVMYTFHRSQILIMESISKESWMWNEATFKKLNPLVQYDYAGNVQAMITVEIARRIGRVIWVTFVFGVISVINAVFIRISIKCSVLIIFPIIEFQNRMSNSRIGPMQQRYIYQSMGDVGALSAYFDRARRSKKIIYFSYICSLVIYYVMYMACYQVWTTMAFNYTFSESLNDGYFFYVNFIELFSFLFIRTRSSIKYFPKFITIANLMFLYYVNSYMYPAQLEGLYLLQNLSLYFLVFFLTRFEYEAINNWNPYGSWTPSETNPRCGYHHVLMNSNYQVGFDLFSIGFPLRFRETFSVPSQRASELLSQEFNFGINYDPRPSSEQEAAIVQAAGIMPEAQPINPNDPNAQEPRAQEAIEGARAAALRARETALNALAAANRARRAATEADAEQQNIGNVQVEDETVILDGMDQSLLHTENELVPLQRSSGDNDTEAEP